MELPFKYMVLCIMRELNKRSMPLVINRGNLVKYFSEFINKAYFTMEEKKKIGSSLNFEYELSDLATKYYHYFDIENEEIIFDSDYIDELDTLISEEMKEYDIEFIYSIDFVIDENIITFLEIMGLKIKKELYDFFMEIEKDIEYCYNGLSDLDNFVGLTEVNTDKLISEIKKLYIKKKVMLINAKNLLQKTEYSDLIKYANDVIDKNIHIDDICLLLEDENFDASNIMYDVYLRSIFTGSDLYMNSLWDSLVINFHGISENIKYSTINFYLMFLELLDKEIDKYDEILNIELKEIKYRIMYVMDSVYGTTLFMNNKNYTDDKVIKERYSFMKDTAYYFIKELLMYNDNKYKNKDCNTDNIMIYLNNIMKKLLIQTYYNLTNDKRVVTSIKENELYGINTISSSFLDDIIGKPKTKTKEI